MSPQPSLSLSSSPFALDPSLSPSPPLPSPPLFCSRRILGQRMWGGQRPTFRSARLTPRLSATCFHFDGWHGNEQRDQYATSAQSVHKMIATAKTAATALTSAERKESSDNCEDRGGSERAVEAGGDQGRLNCPNGDKRNFKGR